METYPIHFWRSLLINGNLTDWISLKNLHKQPTHLIFSLHLVYYWPVWTLNLYFCALLPFIRSQIYWLLFWFLALKENKKRRKKHVDQRDRKREESERGSWTRGSRNTHTHRALNMRTWESERPRQRREEREGRQREEKGRFNEFRVDGRDVAAVPAEAPLALLSCCM